LREKDFSIEIKTIGNSRTKEIGDKEKNKEDKEKTIARLAIQRFAARELKAQLHPRLLPIYISLLFSSPTLLLFTTFLFPARLCNRAFLSYFFPDSVNPRLVFLSFPCYQNPTAQSDLSTMAPVRIAVEGCVSNIA
jgi:hypothetical protein